VVPGVSIQGFIQGFLIPFCESEQKCSKTELYFFLYNLQGTVFDNSHTIQHTFWQFHSPH
jgi:hypothetical protein